MVETLEAAREVEDVDEAEPLRHVDHADHELERLTAERAAEARRLAAAPQKDVAGP